MYEMMIIRRPVASDREPLLSFMQEQGLEADLCQELLDDTEAQLKVALFGDQDALIGLFWCKKDGQWAVAALTGDAKQAGVFENVSEALTHRLDPKLAKSLQDLMT